MIKVYYKGLLKQDTLYNADDFYFSDGVPFKKSGLYITKDNKTVAVITNTEAIDRVEYVNNQPQSVVFNMCDTLSRYDKEELTEDELIVEIKNELNEYYGSKRGG